MLLLEKKLYLQLQLTIGNIEKEEDIWKEGVAWTADLDLIAGKIMRRPIRGQSAQTIETEEAEN